MWSPLGASPWAVNVTLSYWLSAYPLRPVVTSSPNGRVSPSGGPVRTRLEAHAAGQDHPRGAIFYPKLSSGRRAVPFGAYLAISLLVEFVYLVSAVLFGTAALTGDRKAMTAAVVLFILIGATLHILRKNWGVEKGK